MVEIDHLANAERAIDDRQVARRNLQVFEQQIANALRHRGIDRQIDDGTEAALAQALLHLLKNQQIASLVLLQFDIGISQHAEGVRF
jgi:hypothetical protein